jgi:DNA invertase Pin-like site-specific DNA recombinase
MHVGELYFLMARHNVRLRSVQDDSNLEDVLRAVLIGERNTEDSRRKSEAVKAGKRRQFERGYWSGGPAPDGYTVERTVNEDGSVSRRLLIDLERAEVIRLIFSLAKAGHGDPTIARRLNEAGKRTKPHRVRSGRNAGTKIAPGGWTRRRVQDTLTNPIYAGAVVLASRPAHAGAQSEGKA